LAPEASLLKTRRAADEWIGQDVARLPGSFVTYYEELGIQPDASAGEVRQAYKTLARLLHPDRQPDPRLRALAECQMKRLSEVVGLLSDPRRRLQYDAEVADRDGSQARWTPLRIAPVAILSSPPPWFRWAMRNWFWVLLVLAALAVGAWSARMRHSGDVGNAPEPSPAAPSPATASASPRARARERRPRKAVRPVGRNDPLTHLPPELEPGLPQETDPPAPNTLRPPAAWEPPAMAGPPEIARPVFAPATVAESPFGGNWLYVPREQETAAPGQYPAFYVELVLQGEAGRLVGHYWSRHRIPDQAISPEVLLQVQGGPDTGKSATLQWVSADGAAGQVELTLRAPNLLQVAWWTTRFGRHNALSSGTAVLIRQIAR
jgi:curved DNA-binding protein CbpA